MNRATVLLIEDDENMADIISKSLKEENFKVVSAKTGKEGISLTSSICPEVILLDLGLPDIDGTQVIMQLRQWTNIPIIVISARSTEGDKINSLDLGADDYLIKPFGIGELQARVRAALRHAEGSRLTEEIYKVKNMVIDCGKHSVMVDGENKHLTAIEYRILTMLARNKGRVVTYKQLMERIWGPYVDNNNQILRVNVANIRKKIEKEPSKPEYILNEIGIGYRMSE